MKYIKAACFLFVFLIASLSTNAQMVVIETKGKAKGTCNSKSTMVSNKSASKVKVIIEYSAKCLKAPEVKYEKEYTLEPNSSQYIGESKTSCQTIDGSKSCVSIHYRVKSKQIIPKKRK